jgi:hypothetical protein
VAASADIIRVRHTGLRPEPRVAAIVRRYAREVDPIADRVVARAGHGLSRGGAGLGALVARAQRSLARADIAFPTRATCARASAQVRSPTASCARSTPTATPS